MPDIVVRRAEAGDIPAITGIYRPAVEHGTASFEIEPPDETEMLRRLQQICADGYPYLVAESRGEVAGYEYVTSFRSRAAFRFVVEDSVYVAATAQGGGIGRRLLDELVVQSAACGFRQMIAVIGDSRHQASIALHRAAGFTVCGTLQSVGYKLERWLDNVVMQKALGEGDTTPPTR